MVQYVYGFILYILFYSICSSGEKGYIVSIVDKCKMPDYEAFNDESTIIFFQKNYTTCSEKGALTYTSVIDNTALLHINETARKEYYDENQQVDCCYSYVSRAGFKNEPDVGISFSVCRPFNTAVMLKENIVYVRCSKEGLNVYENVHNPIVITKDLNKRINRITETKPVSVLFIVIDSVSRLNLIRTMPKTRDYLLEKGFIEMKGYNKIDDNTFPNFNALITGFNLKQSKSICKPHKIKGLDKCPMIWYDYKKHGYVTAYAEDWTSISTYNYLAKGFFNPPTDYYFKPYFEASERLKVGFVDTMPHCTGPESSGERIMKLASDFSSTFYSKPTFGIFWMNTFSHNFINTPSGMDEKVLNLFKDLDYNQILNDSVVVLLSDHGIRFGDIRKTRTGWIEERLPMNLISLPPWFREKFPLETSFLHANADKLTTTFDMYATLQHFLELSGKNYTRESCLGNANCKSLLTNIPHDRTCEDVGIAKKWCTCYGYFTPIDLNNSTVQAAADLLYKEVSDKLSREISYKSIKSSSISETLGDTTLLLLHLKVDAYDYLGVVRVRNEHDLHKVHIVEI